MDFAIAAPDPDTVYVVLFRRSTSRSALFKSTDGGASWRRIDRGLPHREVTALAIDPQATETVYASLADDISHYSRPDLFKSADGGRSWRPISRSSFSNGVSGIAVDPKHPETLYVASGGGCTACDITGLFKTTDGGRTWTASYAHLEDDAEGAAIDPTNPQHVYGAIEGGVWTSTDGGRTWKDRSAGLERLSPGNSWVFSLAIDPFRPQTVYAGTVSGVYKSTTGGRTWRRSSAGLPKPNPYGPNVVELAVKPDESNIIIAAVGGSGFFRSTNSGRTWNPFNWHLP